MLKLRIKETLLQKPQNQEVITRGWVRTKRESKNFSFIELNDGSCLKNLQVIIDDTISDYGKLIPEITTGCSLQVQGIIVESAGKKQALEIQAKKITIYGSASSDDYPLQKKRHSFEFLREIAHLRPRTNTLGAVARVRSALSYAIHKYFQENGFFYIHTPIITASDCEGAGQMFQVTCLPPDPEKNKDIDYNNDFFGKKTYLTVSGQLEGETYACALGKIYTFGPTFRAEHSQTSRHLAEFWMIEPEMAFSDINDDMDVAEAFLKYIFQYLIDNSLEDMEFFNKWIDKTVLERADNIIQNDFLRITYTEAIDQLLKAKADFEYPVKWGIDLQSEHERYLTEQIFNKPIMVTDYPKEIKAFYMKLNEDNKTVRALDVLVPRLGEIIGGSERENDFDKLKKRMQELEIDPDEYWWYLDLRRFGSVPHAGFGLGFERLIQLATGMQNIRDVIPFPRAYKSAEF